MSETARKRWIIKAQRVAPAGVGLHELNDSVLELFRVLVREAHAARNNPRTVHEPTSSMQQCLKASVHLYG